MLRFSPQGIVATFTFAISALGIGAGLIGCTDVEEDPSGMHIRMQTADWAGTVTLRLAGRFNIHNALAI